MSIEDFCVIQKRQLMIFKSKMAKMFYRVEVRSFFFVDSRKLFIVVRVQQQNGIFGNQARKIGLLSILTSAGKRSLRLKRRG